MCKFSSLPVFLVVLRALRGRHVHMYCLRYVLCYVLYLYPCFCLRVEFLLKTESGYLRDAEVYFLLFTKLHTHLC